MRMALGALALLLGACAPPQAEAPAQFPVVEAPNYDSSIGPNGAAGVTSMIPLTIEAVSAAAPNYAVAEAMGEIEGQPYRKITLSAGDEVVFDVLPTADGASVHALVTRSTQARGPRGEIIGQATFAEAPAAEVPFCLADFVEGAPGFSCATDASGAFWRIYRLPSDYTGATEPFAAIEPDAALRATLAEMRWIAPR